MPRGVYPRKNNGEKKLSPQQKAAVTRMKNFAKKKRNEVKLVAALMRTDRHGRQWFSFLNG
jgi:hypothetical protein